MVKVQAIMDFTYKNYDKIKNLKSKSEKQEGKIFDGDVFEVEPIEALYLTGNNEVEIIAVKVLEIIPEKPKKKKTKKKEELQRVREKTEKEE